MKQERKIFSFKLFLEGVRQLRMIGILFAVLYALQIVILLAAPAISQMMEDGFSLDIIRQQAVYGLSVAPCLLFSFILVAPLLTLMMFNFLNKRNTSDFYHSIPHTRLCVYFSFLSAVFAWLTMLTAEAVLLGALVTAVFSKFYALMWGKFLLFAVGTLIASFAVSAGVTLAMTVTGNVLTNLVISLFVLFLPRLLVLLMTYAICGSLPMLNIEYISGILDNDLNMVSGFVFSFFENGNVARSIEKILMNPSSMIYTVILTAIYAAGACVLFCRRRSETATCSAPNRFLQATYRIALTFMFCAAFICLLFDDLLRGDIDIVVVAIIAIVAAVIYFVYELITTKNFKKLLKSAPGLLVVAACCAALFGSLVGIRAMELNYHPEAGEIKSVSLANNDSFEDYYEVPFDAYARLSGSDVKLTSPTVIRLVSQRLEEQCKILQDKGEEEFWNRYAVYDRVTQSNPYSQMSFLIRAGGIDRYRTVWLTEEEMQLIGEAIESDKAYHDLWTTLPSRLAETKGYVSYEYDIPEETFARIFESAQSELKTVDFAAWYAYCNKGGQVDFELRYMMGSGPAAGEMLTVQFSEELFPKTVQLYYDYEFSQRKLVIESMIKALELIGPKDNALNAESSLMFYSGYEGDSYGVSSDKYEALEFVLKHASDRPQQVGEDEGFLVNVYLEYYGEKDLGRDFEKYAGYYEDESERQYWIDCSFYCSPEVTLKELGDYFDLDDVPAEYLPSQEGGSSSSTSSAQK